MDEISDGKALCLKGAISIPRTIIRAFCNFSANGLCNRWGLDNVWYWYFPWIFSFSHLSYLLFIKILALIYITRKKKKTQKASVFGLNLWRSPYPGTNLSGLCICKCTGVLTAEQLTELDWAATELLGFKAVEWMDYELLSFLLKHSFLVFDVYEIRKII